MLNKKIAIVAGSVVTYLTLAGATFAQERGNITGFEESQVPFTNLGKLLSNAVAVIFFLAGLFAFFFIITGGIQWITAGGDAKAAQAARDRITAAVVGLLVVVAAYAIILILGQVFGINIFQFDFPSATQQAGDN